MKCKKCGYEWQSRLENPKECPRCKTRLDYAKKTTSKEKKAEWA